MNLGNGLIEAVFRSIKSYFEVKDFYLYNFK